MLNHSQWYQERFKYCQVWYIDDFNRNSFTFSADPQKRAAFDNGTDPEDRLGGMGSRGFSTSFRNGAQFEGELSPEDLFNMFFGGGGANSFNSGFGGGPGLFPRDLFTDYLLTLMAPFSCLYFWSWWISNHIHAWRWRCNCQ
jgi:hypothetical protein